MTQFEALANLNTFLRTPGADKFSSRGCELVSKYLLEAEHRALAFIQLAYKPEVERQYGRDVMNDLLERSIAIVRDTNRLFAITSLLETHHNHPITNDLSTIEGLQRIVEEELPNVSRRIVEVSKTARTVMHTVEV